MALVVYRGGGQFGIDELKGHLATLLRLENVAVLLGAGPPSLLVAKRSSNFGSTLFKTMQ